MRYFLFSRVFGSICAKMDEVKDILKDCLEKIDRISSNSATEQSSHVELNPASADQRSTEQVVRRAEANFRAAFPQFRSVSHGPQPKKRKKGPAFVPIVIKDTWTHDFILLASPNQNRTPSLAESQSLALAGLGKKRIVFPDKRGDFKKLRAALEKEYPKLASQRGAFEFLRADRGGASRPLVPIPMESGGGYSIPFLKDIVSNTAAIYIRPMQSKLDLERLVQSTLCDDQVKTQCLNCEREIPIESIRDHFNTCPGGSSRGSSSHSFQGGGSVWSRQVSGSQGMNNQQIMSQGMSSQGSSSQGVSSEEMSNQGASQEMFQGTGSQEQSQAVSNTDRETRLWVDELSQMFPKTPQYEIENAVQKAATLEEAANHVCVSQEVSTVTTAPETSPDEKLYFASSESVVESLMADVSTDDYNLTIDREAVWRGALIFYKKTLTSSDILKNNLTISFKGEDGLDGGAIKAEFFEILLKEIQQRLFEGSRWSLLPVRDSSKGLLFQLAGIIVSHSIVQGGPSFSALCPAVYFYLADANPLYVLSQLRTQDIPLNAGTAVLHELLKNLQEGNVSEVLENHPSSESFWSVINASHWPITKQITDQNVAHLVQNLLESEVILSRKFEIDSFAEGLKSLGFLDVIKKNKEVCFKLLCNSIDRILTPGGFKNLFDASVQRPSDFAQQRSYDWFMEYTSNADAEKLRCLLQFSTGFRSIPPRGLPHKIVLKYLPDDDEKASLPSALACLGVLNLPTIHSTESKFNQSLDIALQFESQGFATI